jgi:hypothetical protein
VWLGVDASIDFAFDQWALESGTVVCSCFSSSTPSQKERYAHEGIAQDGRRSSSRRIGRALPFLGVSRSVWLRKAGVSPLVWDGRTRSSVGTSSGTRPSRPRRPTSSATWGARRGRAPSHGAPRPSRASRPRTPDFGEQGIHSLVWSRVFHKMCGVQSRGGGAGSRAQAVPGRLSAFVGSWFLEEGAVALTLKA